MSLTRRVASYVTSTRFSDLPEEAVATAKKCFLDSLGSILGGSLLPSSRLAAQFAVEVFGQGRARILGTGHRVNPVGAAWANATSNSALDIDDTHGVAMGHPGAVVFPSALAFSQTEAQIDGRRFLEAVIPAYEVSVRIAGSRLGKNRFSFSTGSWGAFAAAAAAGKLMRFNEEEMTQAFCIATAHHPLPPNRKAYLGFGMVKETTGWASMTGTSAALLARMGFTGMEPVLDDPECHDPSAFEDLGKEYKIGKIGFKIYPSCRWNHVALDLILSLRQEHHIMPQEVEGVVIKTFLKASQMTPPSPASVEDAQYSLPFLTSLALRYGELRPAYFLGNHLRDQENQQIASKVRIELNAEFDSLFPSKYATSVEIQTPRGRFKNYAERPRGDAHDPLTMEDLANKFRGLTHDVLNDSNAGRIIDLALHVDKEDSFERLDSLL
jgi:2-methylcitrate dehydratase PrpD